MNVKRIFGVILLVLGIGGLISTAMIFSYTNGNETDVRNMIIYGGLGIIFFFAGLVLIRDTKDEP